MSYDSPVTAGLDLLRHVPPKDVEERMFDIFQLNPELTDEMISAVDIPLKIQQDKDTHQDFIKCDYNRDGDSYRSPFTNKYYPPISDGQTPSPKLRKLEELANKAFSSYLNLFFRYGTLSVYTWDLDGTAFGLGVFVRKDADPKQEGFEGNISCSDVFTITESSSGQYDYEMVSSILLEIKVQGDKGVPVILSGGCADSKVKSLPAKNDIEMLVNVGTMIEDNAANFMEHVKQIYVSKMTEILSYTKGIAIGGPGNTPQDQLAAALKAHMASNSVDLLV
ncbi:F-actin capping protein, beta subunit, putative [Trichomonas vaginalis G3]|uniref:F-actin-capping protein subunit beta n=1 Tax=Trichomonas vaginalis (strain ATCC PRA-98 / G3) TaxID=412133 RepID=A2DBM8_TRIV3|nr:barbed-end actin filament capping [Trichomonas vaginalis G3]EAY22231.1 F-actin capping protein, beta subunit, putative [Trichomonas vaginalis G3]KAI5533311.1 barbed-end actin filament capping [Trichomonas vaginalis G3]|eukprot:XP_001583217.1 F-actin capping protein, beta subunit [Trichomonas vaginalis G3]